MSHTLGSPPPPICTCGHPPEDHRGGDGWCTAVEPSEMDGWGRVCDCPLFELDADR